MLLWSHLCTAEDLYKYYMLVCLDRGSFPQHATSPALNVGQWRARRRQFCPERACRTASRADAAGMHKVAGGAGGRHATLRRGGLVAPELNLQHGARLAMVHALGDGEKRVLRIGQARARVANLDPFLQLAANLHFVPNPVALEMLECRALGRRINALGKADMKQL